MADDASAAHGAGHVQVGHRRAFHDGVPTRPVSEDVQRHWHEPSTCMHHSLKCMSILHRSPQEGRLQEVGAEQWYNRGAQKGVGDHATSSRRGGELQRHLDEPGCPPSKCGKEQEEVGGNGSSGRLAVTEGARLRKCVRPPLSVVLTGALRSYLRRIESRAYHARWPLELGATSAVPRHNGCVGCVRCGWNQIFPT